VAECYLNEEKVDFKVVADAVKVWRDAGKTRRISAKTQERNEAGLNSLRKTYHDLKKSARAEGVPFQSWIQPLTQGTFLPDESTAPGPSDDSDVLSGSEDNDAMPEPVSPIKAPPRTVRRTRNTRTKQKCRMKTEGGRLLKELRERKAEGASPTSPRVGRRAARVGKQVLVSNGESEEVPLQLNRGKERPEKAGKPLPFSAMLGLGTPKTRSDCDPGLEAEMRLLGALEEEEDKEQWDDLPPTTELPEAPFLLGLGAQSVKTGDKIQALLQEKVEREKKKEPPAKGEGLGKQIQWPEGLVQQEAALADVTSVGNIVNPQAQPLVPAAEEKGEEVASPSMRVRAGDQDMMEALLESPIKRKEEAPSPLVQEGGREEAKKHKKSGDSNKERKKAQRAEQAKLVEAALKEAERNSEQESSPSMPNVRAKTAAVGYEEGRAMGIDKPGEGEQTDGQKVENEPVKTQLDAQPKTVPQKPSQVIEQERPPKPESKEPTAPLIKSPAPKPAPAPVVITQIPKSDSPANEAQTLLSSPPPAKRENILANPLTNLTLAQTAPARASDRSTQTDPETPSFAEESWEVTFLANGYVRLEITVREGNGQLQPPVKHMMPEEQFFSMP
jgi:hypothetical protein